jgi:hypothetical protein
MKYKLLELSQIQFLHEEMDRGDTPSREQMYQLIAAAEAAELRLRVAEQAFPPEPMCNACSGTGKVWVSGFVVTTETREKTCHICKGKGYVPTDYNELRTAAIALHAQVAQLEGDAGRYCWPVIRAVAVERLRQMESEGWSREHDDEHTDGALAIAAACLAVAGTDAHVAYPELADDSERADIWGLVEKHGHDRQRNLIIATALLVAEIEREMRLRIDAAKLAELSGEKKI